MRQACFVLAVLFFGGGTWAVGAEEALQATPVTVDRSIMRVGRAVGLGVLGADALEGRLVPSGGPLRGLGIDFTGRRLTLEGLTIEQLSFASPGEAFEYGQRVHRAGEMVVDVRGSNAVVVSGPAAADPQQVVKALEAAWTGRPAQQPRSLLGIMRPSGSVGIVSARHGRISDQVFQALRDFNETSWLRDHPVGQPRPWEGSPGSFTWLSDDHRQTEVVDEDSITRLALRPDQVRLVVADDRGEQQGLTAALEAIEAGTDAAMEPPPEGAPWIGDPPAPESTGVRRVLEGLFGE